MAVQSRAGFKFGDRPEAGVRLSAHLSAFVDKPNVVILGLPRGGVPVAFEVARALHCPMDVLVVRKLGLPGNSECAMGAIASPGVCEWDEDVIKALGVTETEKATILQRQTKELARREKLYRTESALGVRNKEVILVDDGLATGTTMRAAVAAAKKLGASRVVVAVPVGSILACDRLRREVDAIVCPARLADLDAVGCWYDDFHQVSDEEVQDLLKTARCVSR